MYIPKHFDQSDIAAMHSLMRSNPFVALVTMGPEGLCANHLPVEFLDEPRPHGRLVAHVARANPVWQVSNGKEALVIFQGPNAYITPSWYPSKAETGKVVPTWNYAVVHAHGSIRAIDDVEWLRAQVDKLTNQQESSLTHPWAVSDAPPDFTNKLLRAVVGIEITISKLVGKWKVDQHRPEPERAGVASGLRGVGAEAMAGLVTQGSPRRAE